jgi:hypothetical protein
LYHFVCALLRRLLLPLFVLLLSPLRQRQG